MNNSCIVDLRVNLNESGMKKPYPNLEKYLGTFLEILRETRRSQFLQSATSLKFEFMAAEYEVGKLTTLQDITVKTRVNQYTTIHLDIYWSNYVQTYILLYKYVQTYLSANHVLITLFIYIIFL